MDEKKQIDCIHYDAELDCCKVLSDWIDPMPVLVPCVESPCKFYEFGNSEIREMARIISEPECNDETGAMWGYDEAFATERARALYAAGYRKQSGWISVDERLPPKREWVICYSPNKKSLPIFLGRMGNYSDVWQQEGGYICMTPVTHWMPLTKPPKGE